MKTTNLIANEFGVLSEVKQVKKWCVFLYADWEDTNVIKGRCPLIFRTFEEMLCYLGNKNVKENLETNKITYVIRLISAIFP
jgi:Fe-S-cluster containining protein